MVRRGGRLAHPMPCPSCLSGRAIATRRLHHRALWLLWVWPSMDQPNISGTWTGNFNWWESMRHHQQPPPPATSHQQQQPQPQPTTLLHYFTICDSISRMRNDTGMIPNPGSKSKSHHLQPKTHMFFAYLGFQETNKTFVPRNIGAFIQPGFSIDPSKANENLWLMVVNSG